MYYTQEVREQVVAAIEDGEVIRHVCERFNVKYNTTFSWVKKKKLTGSLANKKWKRKLSIDDLLAYVTQNPGETNRHYANHFKVSEALMCQRLKPLISIRTVVKDDKA